MLIPFAGFHVAQGEPRPKVLVVIPHPDVYLKSYTLKSLLSSLDSTHKKSRRCK